MYSFFLVIRCAKPKHHETHFCEKTYGMPEVRFMYPKLY